MKKNISKAINNTIYKIDVPKVVIKKEEIAEEKKEIIENEI